MSQDQFTYTGAGGGSWADAGNWKNGLPTTTTSVIIESGEPPAFANVLDQTIGVVAAISDDGDLDFENAFANAGTNTVASQADGSGYVVVNGVLSVDITAGDGGSTIDVGAYPNVGGNYLRVGAGATLTVGNDTLSLPDGIDVTGEITNLGTITLFGSNDGADGAPQASLSTLAGFADDGGAIDLSGSSVLSVATYMTVKDGGVVNLSGPSDLTTGGLLTIEGKNSVSDSTVTLTNGAGLTAVGGIVATNGGSIVIDSQSTVLTSALTCQGNDTVYINGAQLVITGTGGFTLVNTLAKIDTSTTDGSSVTIGGELSIDSESVLLIGGPGLESQDNVTAGTLDNENILTLQGGQGNVQLTVLGSIVNDGVIRIVSDNETLQGPISVSTKTAGGINLSSGSTLTLEGSVDSSQTITFSGVDTLILENPSSFGATIAGFGAGDAIELVGLDTDGGTVSATVSGQQLIVADGGMTVGTLALPSSYTGAGFDFVANSDAQGDITIYALPNPATVAQYLAEVPQYDEISGGFTISDIAANVSAKLNKLNLDSNITSITLISGTISVSASTFVTYQSTLDKIVGGFSISDSASQVVPHLKQLNADTHITSITLTSGTVSVSVATFAADQSTLDKIVGGFAVSGAASAISFNLNQLNDPNITSITINDNAPVAADVAQLTSDATAIGLLQNENASPVGLAIQDTAGDIVSGLSTLSGFGSEIVSITVMSGGPISVSDTVFDTYQTTLDKIQSGFDVADAASTIAGDLTALEASAADIVSITVTSGAPVTVGVTAFEADQSVLDKIVGGFAISDIASAVTGDLSGLEADHANIVSITATGGTVTVGTATGHTDIDALELIVGGFDISDTAQDIEQALSALNGVASHLDSIISTSGSVTVGATDFPTDETALNLVSGGFVFSDTAANIETALSSLESDAAHVSSIVSTTGSVTVGATEFPVDETALNLVSGGFVFSDTAANIETELASLESDAAHVSSIVSTAGSVTVGATEFPTDETELNLVTGGFVFSDTAANIETELASLESDAAHVSSIVSTAGKVTVGATDFPTDETALNLVTGGFVFSDIAANIETALASLESDAAHVSSIVSTAGSVTVGATEFPVDETALNLVSGGFVFSDTAANIETALASLESDAAHVSSIVSTSGKVTVGATDFPTDETALNLVTGGFVFSDTAANIETALASLESDAAHVSSIVSTSGKVTVGATEFPADETALNLVKNGFVFSGAAAIVETAANLTALQADVAHISSIQLTGTGTHTLTVTATEATKDAGAIGKIAAPYVLDVAHSATVTVTTGHGSGLKITDVKGTDTISGDGTSETFVFAKGFGHATITDAHSHWTGATHDIIDFAKSEFANFTALLADATYSASGTTIVSGSDHLVIDGITSKTALTAADTLGDFKFLA